jgi:uncharacterized repeat protein (TIGR03803 family)
LGIVTILHHFGGSAVDVNGSAATDGTFPASGLIQDSGNNTNFYGTTLNGGAAHKGTAFAMTPLGAVTILHGFGGATDGTFPVAGLTQGNDGNFYGTTSGGGFAGNGVAFEVTPRGGESGWQHGNGWNYSYSRLDPGIGRQFLRGNHWRRCRIQLEFFRPGWRHL